MGEQDQPAEGAWQGDATHLAAGDTILVAESDPPLTGNTGSSPTQSRPRRRLAPGDQFGRFTLLDRLGAGGMGVVFAAYDPELDRKVAIKFLLHRTSQKPTSSARLLREAKALARLNHPGVITVHDVGAVNRQVFIAMEYVEGKTLRAWSEAEKRNLQDVLKVYISAGRGLVAAHNAGLVHRDFKPENVLLGNDGRVRVLDFGLARAAADGDCGSSHAAMLTSSVSGDAGTRDSDISQASYSGSSLTSEHSGIALLSGLSVELTQDGAIIGTPAFMAPEQHLGKIADARSDQYAFC
ncbi:MAG: serine/threonine-protein kinase, partial [Nannocystaceae bacterium]